MLKIKPTVELKYNRIVIKFNGLLHVTFKRSNLISIQSWRQGENNYYIEYLFNEGNPLLTDYDSKEKWEEILKELEKVLD